MSSKGRAKALPISIHSQGILMLNTRGTLVLSLAVIAIAVMLMGFSDKLKHNPNKLCDVTKIDRCARTGGLER